MVEILKDVERIENFWYIFLSYYMIIKKEIFSFNKKMINWNIVFLLMLLSSNEYFTTVIFMGGSLWQTFS